MVKYWQLEVALYDNSDPHIYMKIININTFLKFILSSKILFWGLADYNNIWFNGTCEYYVNNTHKVSQLE